MHIAHRYGVAGQIAGDDPMELGSALNVLLVDDDVRKRVSVCERLRNQGLKVIESSDAEQAMAVLQSRAMPVDAVITEAGFPQGRDGFFLADWVRRRYPEVAIGITSKTVGFADANSRLANGVAFIERPYDVDMLILLLHELLQEKAFIRATRSRSVAARESTSTRAAGRRRRPVRTS